MIPRDHLPVFASLVLAALALAGCGYVGDPLPPTLHIPVPVDDLRGVQRGSKVYLAFTTPAESTDKVLLKSLSAIDLRAGINSPGGFNLDAWALAATPIPVETSKTGEVTLDIPCARWENQEMVFAVRTAGPTRHASRWSNLLVLHIVPTPEPPSALKLDPTPKGAFLQWQGDGDQWRVWRKSAADPQPVVLGLAGERSWLDPNVEFGQTYTYSLQQIVGSGDHPAESEMSHAVSVKYEDIFPPAVPTGLAVIAGIKSVELNWDRNTEPDWKACQVYRAEAGAELQKLGPPVLAASFSDSTIISGRKYRYAVSSIDQAGNESAPSAPVEIVAP